MANKIKEKVVAYITRNNHTELLVFDHEKKWSEAGIQVPAGSIEENETPSDAVIRETLEESGLRDLEVTKKIDEYTYFRKELKEENLRYVFLLKSTEVIPESWQHVVSGDGIDKDMTFSYYWITVEEAKQSLAGGLGQSLKYLLI